MRNIGFLKTFKKTNRYAYRNYDLEKTINSITYCIWIDLLNSNKKTKNIKYIACIKFNNGIYSIKRNLNTKKEAKSILDKVFNDIQHVNISKIRNILINYSAIS